MLSCIEYSGISSIGFSYQAAQPVLPRGKATKKHCSLKHEIYQFLKCKQVQLLGVSFHL